MAAPVAVNRVQPVVRPIWEGFHIEIACVQYPNLCMWEIDVKPPAIDGQEPLDVTTQFNKVARTYFPRFLIKYDMITCEVAYPAKAYEDLERIVNVNQNWCITFPTSDQLAFWGFLQKFEPAAEKEGDFPKASVTIVISNMDLTYNEFEPVFIPAIGT